MSKLVNCKACGKEIGKGVSKCVSCGTDQRNFFGKHKIITGILAIVIIGGIVSAAGGDKSKNTVAPAVTTPSTTTSVPVTPAPATPKSLVMDKAGFDTIKNGMSYAEVSAIVGPGEMVSETGTPGDQFYTVAYDYKGEGGLGANASLIFQGGKLNMKSQMGLK